MNRLAMVVALSCAGVLSGTALGSTSMFERFARRNRQSEDVLAVAHAATTANSGTMISAAMEDETTVEISVDAEGVASLWIGGTLIAAALPEHFVPDDGWLHLDGYDVTYGTYDVTFAPGESESEVVTAVELPDWGVSSQLWVVGAGGAITRQDRCICGGTGGTVTKTCGKKDCDDTEGCRKHGESVDGYCQWKAGS